MKHLRYLFTVAAVFGISAPASTVVADPFTYTKFDGILVVTTDPAVTDKWHQTPDNVTPRYAFTRAVFPEQDFSVVMLVGNMQLRRDSIPDVRYDIEIRKPDSTLYLRERNVHAFDYAVEDPDQMNLCGTNLRLSFEPNDPRGKYTIRVALHDMINDKRQDLTGEIMLVDFLPGGYEGSITNDGEFATWMQSYRTTFSAEKIVDAWQYFVNSHFYDDTKTYRPMIRFFVELFHANRFGLRALQESFDSLPDTTRYRSLKLFALVGRDANAYLPDMDKQERAVYDEAKAKPLADPYGQVSYLSEIDILWAIYLATGQFRPIRKLVDVLELGSPLERVQAAAKQSLKENAATDIVVEQYCRHILNEEELRPRVKAELTDLLEN